MGVRISYFDLCLEIECSVVVDSVGDLSVSASSDILSASLIGISKKQFIMMPPEDKLTVVERRAQDHEDKQEVRSSRKHGSVSCTRTSESSPSLFHSCTQDLMHSKDLMHALK